MGSDQLVYILLSVDGDNLGRKYLFSIWAAKYFSKELGYWQSHRSRGYLIPFFYHHFSLSCKAVEFVCLYKFIIKQACHSLMCDC